MSKKKTISATEQLAEAKAQLELAQIEKVSQLLESNQPVVVPWMEYPAYDEYSYTAKSPYFYSSISDRQGEQYLPLYRNEMDLRMMRARARNMETLFSVAVGARDCLTNYTIGNGISVEVQPKASGSESLARQLQAEIDGFLDYNNFPGVMDREIHQLSRVEGECFPTLYEEDENIRCEITDTDAITEPAQPMPLERMARTNGKLNHWHLGVHTTYSKILKRDDAARPLGYHAVYDELGDDWDYLPANRVEHIKRNVLRSARRGWSDYEAVIEDLEQLAKIKRNTAVGAAILAAIVLIREHAPGVSKSSIESMVSGGATSSRTVFTDTGGGRTRYSEHTAPGTVKDIPNGMKSMLGPLGSLNSPIYIEVAQFVLRIISVRWGIPEYMISGDASNNNLNSADMAESSFAKFREADQGFYSRHFEELLWKVIAIRLGAGALGGLSLKQIKAAVQIKVTLPDVVSRDTKDLAAENEILIRNRVKSRRTWAGELGLDYDEEQREIAEEDAQAQERIAQEMEIQAANQPDPELSQKMQEGCGANGPGGGGFQRGNTCAKSTGSLTSDIKNKAAKNYADSAIAIAEQNGDPLPRSIMLHKLQSRAVAMYGQSMDTIWISSSLNKNKVAHLKSSVERGFLSQENPVLHELGHKYHSDIVGSAYDNQKNYRFNDSQKAVAMSVSKYAATNGLEFVAETYAGVRSGKTYGKEVFDLLRAVTGGRVSL